MKESNFLARTEQELLEVLDRFIDYNKLISKNIEKIDLDSRQWKVWVKVVAKASRNPKLSYAQKIVDGKYRGVVLSCLAARKRYTKRCLERLDL